MNILVTGAKGFIAKNLIVSLRRQSNLSVWEYDLDSSPGLLEEGLSHADVIFHLAGVNRPERVEEFREGNTDSTRQICDAIRRLGRKPLLVLSSSTQATLDNPYGVSKRQAEETVFTFELEIGAPVAVFRFPGIFGKWCRPNYNSVVATFCYSIAHDLPITISDSVREVELVYIDDVVAAFIKVMNEQGAGQGNPFCYVEPTFHVTLGNLADTIRSFHESRNTLLVPTMRDRFTRSLYATYISYLPTNDFGYKLRQRVDQRGELAELFKSPHFGQVFVSRTRPSITRGNHYHDTKVEKFVVLEGEAAIRFRNILGADLIEYSVSGKNFQVIDIPPGYAHSIENVGQTDLVVLFWADEILDPAFPDTYPLKVLEDK